jgi:hypothetical protein
MTRVRTDSARHQALRVKGYERALLVKREVCR